MIAPALCMHPGFIRRYDFPPTLEAVRHYNPSIVEHRGGILMAWRIQDSAGYSRIVASRLTKNLNIVRQVDIQIDAPAKAHIEDPRLILIQGKLHLLVAQVVYGATYKFILRAFILDEDLQPSEEIPLPYGQNGVKTEKNWIPFELPSGSLGLVYSIAPQHVVIDTATGEHFRTPGVERWRWGTISGRTNAIRLSSGSYLAFIGGHVPHPRRRSLYWAGAYLFSGDAPHAIIGVSSSPLLWASPQDPAIVNPFDDTWNPLCVFPAGLVRSGGDVLVSLGLNDSYCCLLRWNLEDIMAGIIPPDAFTGTEVLTAPAGAPPPGDLMRVRVISRQPLGEPGGPYIRGQEFFTTADRVSALGGAVEVLEPKAQP